MYRSFTYLVTFIPKHFIIFDAIVNGIIFLISLSDSSLLQNTLMENSFKTLKDLETR